MECKRFEVQTKGGYTDSVGIGWKPIVEPLINSLKSFGGELHQVKEKFGGLRFYYDLPETVTEAERITFADAVSAAEALSFHICEACGEVGEPGGKAWIKTLCPVHRKEWDVEYERRAANNLE